MAGPLIDGWDIETTNLNANVGWITHVGVLDFSKNKPLLLSIQNTDAFKKNAWDDSDLVAEARERLEQSDGWVFHFGEYFDIPFFNTRCLLNGIEPLSKKQFVDTWRVSKKKLKLTNNRLATLAETLDLEDQKMHVSPKIWGKAMAGHIPSLEMIGTRCISDVVILKQAYEKLPEYIDTGINMALFNPEGVCCPHCGHEDYKFNGYHFTPVGKYRRFACKRCKKKFQETTAVRRVKVKK